MTSTGTRVSIIIPFYGNLSDLQKCLKGLKNQDYKNPYEIIVIDSVNKPEVKQLTNINSGIKFLSYNSVLYPGKARNIGVKNSIADLLAFIDADCVPLPNWLSEIYLSLINGNEIVIGPVINMYPLHPVASTDNLLQFPDFQKFRTSSNITHFPACNLGITKKLFNKTNGFPEDVLTGEDVIFSQSAISINKGNIFYNKKLIVKHSGRKNIISFIEHNKNLGFYRGYLSLKIGKVENNFRNTFLFAFIFGVKRFFYIIVRTAQWNLIGLLRIIFFSPFFILGLSAWVDGFWQGNKQYIRKKLGI